jgi:hypothetical protein
MAYHEQVARYESVDANTWMQLSETAELSGDLPLALALLHRDVVPISREEWKGVRGGRGFRYSPSPRYMSCASAVIWGYVCPYRREPLQLDHAWPYALGGPAVVDNAVWLCPIHNRAKSDDVHAYPWDSVWPSWVGMHHRAVLRRLR